MSMYEALRGLKDKAPWLAKRDEDETLPPAPPNAFEEAEALVFLAKAQGKVDRQSATWAAVSRWAAKELILLQKYLETATGDKATEARGAAKKLRDLLVIDERAEPKPIEDPGPYVP